MCTNFIRTASDMLVQFGIERAPFDYQKEAYPGYDAPIIAHSVRAKDEERSKRVKGVIVNFFVIFSHYAPPPPHPT